MSTRLYPTDLTDSQWEIIQPLIPLAKSGGRPRTLDMRLVINGVLYVTVGGIQWRMLPKEYPKRLFEKSRLSVKQRYKLCL
jgi:putative transposase